MRRVMASVVASRPRPETIAVAILGAALAALYAPVLRDLVVVWASVPYYSHGFIVPLFSAYVARDTLKDAARRGHDVPAPRPDIASVALTLSGLVVLALGVATASLTLKALSIPLVLMGLARALLGAAPAWRLAFPIGFLVFMAPLPDRAVTAVSPPLQHLAAVVAEHGLRALGIPVTREELFVKIPSVTMHVTEDCTGLRFLLAMLVIGVACAALTQRRAWTRAAIVLIALTFALLANLIRVTGTGVLAELWGVRAAMGLPHIVWGKAVYGAMLVPFAGVVLLLRRRQ
jgi:exosortase